MDEISNTNIYVPNLDNWESHVFHLFPILSNKRDELQLYLKILGIQTLIHYPIPPHKQICYPEFNSITLPLTEKIHNEELSLPISSAMIPDEISLVIEKINIWQE